VLTVSALKLLGTSNVVVLAVLCGTGLGALITYARRRSRSRVRPPARGGSSPHGSRVPRSGAR
jgi:hypothetical protein